MAQFAVENLAQVNEFLSNNNYLNGDLPGADDVRIFNALKGVPPKDQFPEVYFWYLLLSSFTPAVRAQWAPAAAPKKDAPKKEAPKKEEPKKEEPKKAEDDVDLFGDDDVDPEAEKKAKALAEQKKQEALAKKNKPKPVAKTIVIFEVKIFEATDQALLESTAKKVKETINPDGLTWEKEVKFEEIAYGAKKIVMSMIIEDDKILTDDVFDQITAWEDDVSSVDIVSMQRFDKYQTKYIKIQNHILLVQQSMQIKSLYLIDISKLILFKDFFISYIKSINLLLLILVK